MESSSQLLRWVIQGLTISWITCLSGCAHGQISDDPREQYFPPTGNFVHIKQKSGDPPIRHVRVNCFSSSDTGTEPGQRQDLEPGDVMELSPADDVSVKCSFVWARTGETVGFQNFVIFSAPQNPEILMLPFYCRICLWIFDHQGFHLYKNVTKSYVHVHDWIFEH